MVSFMKRKMIPRIQGNIKTFLNLKSQI